MTLFRDLLIDKKRRKYYCEVEYLQSSGTQYINTGIIPSAGMRIVIKAESLNNTTWAGYIGSWDRDNSSTAISIRQQTSNTLVAPSYGGNPGAYSTTVTADAHIFELKEGEFYVDGVQKLTWTTTTTSLSTYPIFMFVENLGGSPWQYRYSSLKVYFCKIYKDNVLIRDLIPVLDWSYTPCMYDKISGKLFYNQGTGNFTYGREIHYVEYLESTGTQYIDTGVILATPLKVDMELAMLHPFNSGTADSNYPVMFGANDGDTRRNIFVRNNYGDYQSDTSCRVEVDIGNAYNRKDIDYGKRFEFYYDQSVSTNNTIIDGTTYTYPVGNWNVSCSLYLFAQNNNGTLFRPGVGRIYICKLWISNVLERDFIPAIDENGVGFMFDRVTHTIYDNAGTGQFIPASYQLDGNGRVVEPEYE